VIAIDDDESRTNAEERRARGLARLRESRSMARKLDRCTQEGGGERV
jgi:hypothetical protein